MVQLDHIPRCILHLQMLQNILHSHGGTVHWDANTIMEFSYPSIYNLFRQFQSQQQHHADCLFKLSEHIKGSGKVKFNVDWRFL
jgi:hypothetical protein